ncbi:MAG: type II toxin-antitoxin system Phd/YefM family antitoxin [Deltaproteobacteria bacterium]|nr:type II toxin-antitoxin system Phd/YefM family antitoxin [Deltaproteobacteria bacterium]
MNRSVNSPTSVLQVAEDIVPIGELKAHLSEKIRALKGTRRPLVVTQNGKAAAVMLAPEVFDRLTTQARFVAAVQDGLTDLDAGRVVTDEGLGRRLDARFGALSKATKKK